MQDNPSADLLIAEVKNALGTGIALGFAQKVAANALGIAQREYDLAPRSQAQEFDRLDTLIGSDGDLAERNRRLSEDIRYGSGKLDDMLVRHLILTTLAKIEVDQPTYPPFLTWKNAE